MIRILYSFFVYFSIPFSIFCYKCKSANRRFFNLTILSIINQKVGQSNIISNRCSKIALRTLTTHWFIAFFMFISWIDSNHRLGFIPINILVLFNSINSNYGRPNRIIMWLLIKTISLRKSLRKLPCKRLTLLIWPCIKRICSTDIHTLRCTCSVIKIGSCICNCWTWWHLI